MDEHETPWDLPWNCVENFIRQRKKATKVKMVKTKLGGAGILYADSES